METETASPLEGLIQTLDHPETHILPLLHSKESAEATRKELLQTCQFLFQEIEGLAKTYQSLKKKDAQDTTPPGLSGLSELYVSEGAVDAETIWGQVDLQNDALKKLLKKSVKNLGKSTDDICVLDMGEVFSEDEEEQNSNDDNDDDDDDDQEEKSGSDEEESDGEDDDVDEETKRIRERMERALDDMGSDQEEEEQDSDEESSESDEKAKAVQPKKSEQEDLVDPAAEELNDGFFDINEMENFADEEEEYLPDEAFGQPKKEKKTLEKKSFHQRQRDGDLDSGSDEDGSDDEDFEEQQVVRRKKYREDDEIDALHDLYKEPESEEEEEEDEEGDIVNMTAADLFGKPNKKYYEQYKTKPKSKPSKPEKGDDDSWGEYDFDKEDQSAWRDDNSDEEADEEDDENKEEDASDDEEEEEAMNDEEVGSSKKKNEDNSKHARQDEKLRRQTEQLEKEMLAEKPWQMTGEAKGTSRPVNSLLEGTPEFQVASKQAPTITIEHTTNLEDIIKQRVIAEDWDDLVPRELPDVGWHKNRGELPEVSQEKSKLGLGELYEREYLKKAVGYDVDAAEKQTEEDKARNEMKQLFANLCSKLDALSNYHFAPRPIADEAEVRPITTPAIAMEEVLPLHVSDARGVAPEEVYGAKRGRDGILRGETEMDQTERKRMRMSKKSARRKVRKDKLADEKLISRLEPGLGLNNPYEKRKIREELTEARAHGRVTTGEKEAAQTKYGSSGTFFKRLQTEAQESIRDNTAFGEKKEEKSTKPKSSSYKL